ncbi:MAG: DUF2236 domain-containing protein [Anaerolineae bacterium]|nr:DUF2236 domain-containing protein [Anaerolineae bacterium]
MKVKSMNETLPLPSTPYGYFSPDEAFWQVNRELLIILAGARAVMLELAHPLVAAGVAQHSNFRRDSLGRLYRTVFMMVDATFGSAETARRAVGRVYRCHRAVEGGVPTSVGPFAAQTGYQANDPHLKLWVLATLIDSILLVHDLFVRPLSLAEKEAYYRDSRLLGRMLGIPAPVLPPAYADFTAYVERMFNSDTLTVGDTAREVTATIFGSPPGALIRAVSFAGLGLLPPRLRADFNIPWDDRRERRLQWLARQARGLRATLPPALCVWPHALLGQWYFERAKNCKDQSPSRTSYSSGD